MKTAKSYSGKLELPTYPLGPDDKEPPIWKEFTPRGAEIYPYTTQEVLGDKAVVKTYEALFLENDYLKLTFLPELNGRLYSAFDKVNGNELFYANPVIKPGLFAVRGAWAAVGVEFNFPNSHTASTLDPIHAEIKNYPDGSASVIVGDIEKTTRMGWSVETKLSPDSSAIFMESKLYNPTDTPHRFYYWVNAACPVYGESEFIFPPSTRKLLTHPPMDASRLAKLDYPVSEETDIRFFKNIKQHFPVFAENMDEDFFGLYHHNKDYGVVHVADHALVRGRKLWTFGTARDGRIFIDQLSQNGADYCELQTGPFSLQSDYRMLHPGRMHIQRESWLPVAHTGGFNLACNEFAAKITTEDNEIKIKLCASIKLEDVKAIVVSENSEVAVSEFCAEPCRTININLKARAFDKIIFRDSSGNTLAVFNSTTEEYQVPDIDVSSFAGPAYNKGIYLEEQGHIRLAADIYEQNSADTRCLLNSARLAFDQGSFDEAEKILSRLEQSERNNPERLVLHGLLQYKKGNMVTAERAFSRAADDNRYRDRALFYLARCAAAAGDYKRAIGYIEELRSYGTFDVRALRLQAFCMKKTGMSPTATDTAIKEMFCISDLMEVVCELIELRHYEDATELLGKAISDDSALKSYYIGWLKHMSGQEEDARKHLDKAASLKWSDPFLYRIEDEAVLRYALTVNPGDATANYQLGCLLASKDRWDEAAPCWTKVSWTAAKRNLAIYYWKIKNNRTLATEFFRHAAFADDAGTRTILEAEIFFGKNGDINERLRLFKNRENLLEKDSRLKLAFVKVLLDNDQPEKAFDMLINGNFRLCEGKMLSRSLYERTCGALAEKAEKRNDYEEAVKFYMKAAEYPENIGIGKPSGNKEAKWHYLAGEAYKKLGLIEKAHECFRVGSEKGDWLDIPFFPLKKMIWEADDTRIDSAYQENLRYRSMCPNV